jgi:hypothetical protein
VSFTGASLVRAISDLSMLREVALQAPHERGLDEGVDAGAVSSPNFPARRRDLALAAPAARITCPSSPGPRTRPAPRTSVALLNRCAPFDTVAMKHHWKLS